VVNDPYLALQGAHAVAVLTEWDEFKEYDWSKVKSQMKKPSFLFDGRKVLDKKHLKEIGFIYYSIGE